MQDTPFFSVVIPTYNREKHIKKAIDSVLAQTFTDFEVLVIDDGSTDGTRGVVQAYTDPRVRYIYQENRERGAARNHGARLARGSYICYLDSDDYWFANHLEAAHHAIGSSHRRACHHFAHQYVSPTGELQREQRPNSLELSDFSSGNPLSCNAVVIPKEVLEKYPFREERGLAGSEDYELWLRLAAHVGWVNHPNQITSVIVNDPTIRGSFDNKAIDRLLTRSRLVWEYLKEDEAAFALLKPYYSKIKAAQLLYAALHLALGKHRIKALQYLTRSIVVNPRILFRRTSLAVIKHVLLT